ncbi:MAG: DUF4340 domain-containing protein [Gammaproteobacteria bacterium]|nr:DUF4340 domain-containing protein [Gammaproteobacteria bacterium]
MSRQAKTNIILFSLVIFLSFIAWFQPGLQQTVLYYLSSLKADEINTILIQRQGIGQIKLHKKTHGWFLQEPYPLPANPLRIDTIIALVEKRSYSRFQAADDELVRFHLDDPLVSIWLNESKFVIGSDNPVNHQRYAMNLDENTHSGTNTIHLINGSVFYQLRSNLDSFISPRLLPPGSNIKSIAWANKKLIIDQGIWQLTPDDPTVASDSIAQFIQFWKNSRASQVETNVQPAIDISQLTQSARKSKTISIAFSETDDTSTGPIQYLIIQEGEQIKLWRSDIKVAYLITPQILKLLSEFIPVQQSSS